MKQIIVITGASSGFGALAARRLADAGHAVYAGMRATTGRNSTEVEAVHRHAKDHQVDLRAIEMDVAFAASCDAAIRQIIAEQGRLDVVVALKCFDASDWRICCIRPAPRPRQSIRPMESAAQGIAAADRLGAQQSTASGAMNAGNVIASRRVLKSSASAKFLAWRSRALMGSRFQRHSIILRIEQCS